MGPGKLLGMTLVVGTAAVMWREYPAAVRYLKMRRM